MSVSMIFFIYRQYGELVDRFKHTSFVTPMMIHEMILGQPLEGIDLALKTSCHFY